jgi:hypothetical protein
VTAMAVTATAAMPTTTASQRRPLRGTLIHSS